MPTSVKLTIFALVVGVLVMLILMLTSQNNAGGRIVVSLKTEKA